jgi:large subunit ribosomal protein L33
MASKNREIIKLKSTESTEIYWTTKNKKNGSGRLELKKYDKKLKRHVIFREAK